MSLRLEDDGSVSVAGVVIDGAWRKGDQCGLYFFEDPGVLCTDEMTKYELEQYLADIFVSPSN